MWSSFNHSFCTRFCNALIRYMYQINSYIRYEERSCRQVLPSASFFMKNNVTFYGLTWDLHTRHSFLNVSASGMHCFRKILFNNGYKMTILLYFVRQNRPSGNCYVSFFLTEKTPLAKFMQYIQMVFQLILSFIPCVLHWLFDDLFCRSYSLICNGIKVA